MSLSAGSRILDSGTPRRQRHAAVRRQKARTDGSQLTRPFPPRLGAQAPRHAAALSAHGRRSHRQRGGVRDHRRRAARLGARQGDDGPGRFHGRGRDVRCRHFRLGDFRRGLGRARVVIGRRSRHVRWVLMFGGS